MDINYLLAGIYGEEAARYRFESMCAALIYEEQNSSGTSLASKQLLELRNDVETIDENRKNFLESKGSVYAVRTIRGDGGLDIILEEGNNWTVYQCKFFKDDSINTPSRKTQIKNSFEKSLETAKNYGKTIIKWVLCVPLDFSNDEREKYWNEFVKEHNKYVPIIDTMLKTSINTLLMKHVHIFNFYFSTVKRPHSNKRMYDSLKELNRKLKNTSASVKRPGVEVETPSLYKIADEHFELFDTYTQLFTLYAQSLRDLLINMDELSEQTQLLRQQLQTVKGRNDPRGIEKQELCAKAIENNYAKLDEFGVDLNKVIEYLDSIASSLVIFD